MLKILQTDDIDLPDHTQVFHGQHGQFFLLHLIQARASGQNGHAEAPADQILDAGDAVNLHGHIEFVQVEPLAFQRGGKQVARIGIGQPEDQPFIFQFNKTKDTGKYITSDELYFQLGKTYPYPLPSNSMQGLGFCTLTPGEVKELKSLILASENKLNYSNCENISKHGEETLFREGLVNVDDDLVNEAQLEFTILSSLKPFSKFLSDNYILCRQVPICPFKPMNMDRADICLYSLKNPIKNGTIPNIIIELKKDKSGANAKAYDQVVRYLHWIESITNKEDFNQITAFLISPEFRKIKRNKVDLTYEDKIKMYSIKTKSFIKLQ